MKINWNKKYNTYAAYACAVGAAIIFFIFLGIHYAKVLGFVKQVINVFAPLIYGAAIAYILNPICKLFERKLFVKIKFRKLKRAIGMVLSYSIFFALIALLVYAIIPELARSFNDLQNNLIVYANSLQEWVDSVSATSPQFGAILKSVLDYIDIDSISESVSQLFASLSDIMAALAPVIRDFIELFGVQLKNIFLGFIFSAYFLASKELVAAQIRKLGHALISDEKYEKMSYFIRFSDHTFGRYLMGTLVDSILVGIEFFIVLSVFRFPYAPLVSIVCGFTNMIPIFGPFIGAIPSFIIIFIADPIKALWFILIVLLIQQIDGNIIAPRILGESTGLSAIAVISAVTIMGGFFGILGMVVGVPLCAVFANLINNKTDERIKAKEAARAESETENNGSNGGASSEDDSKKTDEAQSVSNEKREEAASTEDAEKKDASAAVSEPESATEAEKADDEKAVSEESLDDSNAVSESEEPEESLDGLPVSERAKKLMSQILRNCMKISGKGGKKR